MKAISIIEPYASLVACGAKKIETRGWGTKYRGPILIHASKTRPPKSYMENPDLISFIARHELHSGEIIAKATLVDCIKLDADMCDFINTFKSVEHKYGFYSPGRYAWILRDVERINHIKTKGHLGIWNYEGGM